MRNVVHHIELWTTNVEQTASSFDWLLTSLDWSPDHDPAWTAGRIWHHPSGVYLVLEQSPDVSGSQERTRAGLNHLALRVDDREHLDRLRAEVDQHGWREMFTERYPHAGGPNHSALFIENAEGFEVELVAD
ncbi:VOC family protein [Luteococcus sp. Sow4_B9]|uniref:VOC family protein n=1 Tax=Luteococcus sp. Sow4_B9 TaxID=3438792 RepID=UPI003F95F318